MTVRVVSLVPSATETLLSWDVVPAACTRFCEQPLLPHVGGTKDPDIQAIAALRPDLVVMDREENRKEDADALAAMGVPLHVMHVTSLAAVPGELQTLAKAVDVSVPPVALPAARASRGTAVAMIWRRPWMALGADTYGASVLRHVGLQPIAHHSEDRYPEVALDDVARRKPDVVVLPSEPYPFADRHRDEITAAVPDANVVLVDGRDLVWWGSRSAAAVQRLGSVMDGLRAARPPR